MKTALILFIAGICGLALAHPYNEKQYDFADKVWLQRQKDIMRMVNYNHQPSYYKDIIELSDSFKWDGHWDQWTKPEYAKEFWYYYQHDILPQGEVFSLSYPEHEKQAIALFRTFHWAKDWDTFHHVAAWSRQHVNEGMFLYSYLTAVFHNQWTHDLIIPPIYEIYPFYFFNDEVIIKVQQYKQHYWGVYDNEEEIKDKDFKGYTIHANYSSWYLNVHPEQSMTYYTEDVGYNSYNFYYHMYQPTWLHEDEGYFAQEFRGEFFFWYHQQILSRYYLERLSNGLGEIPHFSYDYPIETGYYPSLTHGNGLKFPTRPNHAHLYYHGVHGEQSYPWYGNYSYSYTYVNDYERRLRDALDLGYFYTPEGKQVHFFTKDSLDILGNLVQHNAQSLNDQFYGDLLTFASHLLGYSHYPLDEYKLSPSALEHHATAFRDPMFYQLFKRILHYYHQHQDYIGPYVEEELYFKGVKIEDISVDRLVTFFDYFYSDIANVVSVDEQEFETESFQARARQYRLNHKPFNYKINVDSEKPADAFVKIFIGPKYDEYGRELNIQDNYKNFFEIDRFHYALQAGKNVIERNCHDSKYFSQDRTTFPELYEQIFTAYKDGSKFKYYQPLANYGFPLRMMLPKGDFGGQTYQFYVFIAPYHAPKEENQHSYFVVDTEYSLGYPLDRPIEFEHEFFVPNSYFKDVVIYHQNVEEDIDTTWSKY